VGVWGLRSGLTGMLLHIVARGKIGRSPEAELVERYAKRIVWPFKLTELPETGGNVPALQTPAREVLLDERGAQLSSEDFAALLGKWRDGGIREARFTIGAADGHGVAAREQADFLLGFGEMTWPHLLVRAMLAEQLWRATSILAGHPYHRSG
jgi:23S rRNA (pseudouridine1915-N3)-methyltransferase